MQMGVHKTLYPFQTTMKIPHVMSTVTKTCFVGSNSQVHYDNLHNWLTAAFQSGAVLFKEQCHSL